MGTPFGSNSDPNVLRCIRTTNGFKVLGYTHINNNSPLEINFIAKSLVALNNENIGVDVYGVSGDTTTLISRRNNVAFMTHTIDTVPLNLHRDNHIKIEYYSTTTITEEHTFEFEGNLNLRAKSIIHDPDYYFTI